VEEMDSIPVDIEAAAASVKLFRKAMLTTGSFIRISLALPITFFLVLCNVIPQQISGAC